MINMPFSEKLKEDLVKKANYRCSICHRLATLQIHHIVPQCEGGSDEIDNAVPLCVACHKIYGFNPLNRMFIKRKRDNWYEKAKVDIQNNENIRGKIVKGFIHRTGVHCESSAMRDMFEFQGFPMSEALAFGLDGTLGFVFFDRSTQTADGENLDTPFFVGGKQGSIAPNSLACRLLGITMRKQSFTSADKAWNEAKVLLDQNVPLLLQVDLGFLPYMEEEEEIHFGGHAITLAGYDEEEQTAYIGDTVYTGFQKVPIEQLKKARGSTFGPKFLHPNNAQYSMTRRPDGKHPPLAAGAKLAIQEAVNHMLRPSMNYIGIQGLKRFANSIPNWKDTLQGTVKNPYNDRQDPLAQLTFELIHGYIETWGTGGACFRNLFVAFLEELRSHPEVIEGVRKWNAEEFEILEEAIPMIRESATMWTTLANTLKNTVDEHKEDCLNYVNLDELSEIACSIYNLEEGAFKLLSKIKN